MIPVILRGRFLKFVQVIFPELPIVEVEINQSKVSLNSVNGTLTDIIGKKYFFKFHAEEGETKTVSEYYQGQILAGAGLPLIQPLYQKTTPGEQFLIYENITAPTAFDLCEQFERAYETDGSYPTEKNNYLAAEQRLLKLQLDIYLIPCALRQRER